MILVAMLTGGDYSKDTVTAIIDGALGATVLCFLILFPFIAFHSLLAIFWKKPVSPTDAVFSAAFWASPWVSVFAVLYRFVSDNGGVVMLMPLGLVLGIAHSYCKGTEPSAKWWSNLGRYFAFCMVSLASVTTYLFTIALGSEILRNLAKK